MRFYTLEEKKPEYGEEILVKIRSFSIAEKKFYYYVVCRTAKSIPALIEGALKWENQDVYEEAMGEQYSYWKEEEIVGWTSFNEIEKNEKWN